MMNSGLRFAFCFSTAALTLACSQAADPGGDPPGNDPGGGQGATANTAGSAAGGARGSGAPSFGGRVTANGGTAASPPVINLTGGSGGDPNFKRLDGGTFLASPQEIEQLTAKECAGWQAEPEGLSAVLMMVIDVSSSMNREAPGAGGLSKWEVARAALLDAVVGTPANAGLPENIAVGLLFYPNQRTTITREGGPLSMCLNTEAMVLPALLGPAGAPHRTLVANAIATVELNRSTPTHDAYTYGFDEGLLKSATLGERHMLLITDGTPTVVKNCMDGGDPRPIVDEITRVAQAGVKTFLIGVPGSERNRPWMSEAAVIGGTAIAGCSQAGPENWCHMDMTTAPDFSQALRDGLARVAGAVIPCAYDTVTVEGGQRIDPTKTNVSYSGKAGTFVVVRDDIGECTEGWKFNDQGLVELCPATCKTVQEDSEARVKVSYGCESLPGPPK